MKEDVKSAELILNLVHVVWNIIVKFKYCRSQ